ncbi:MAG: hypothetical protein HZC40_11760 [Chloroflexi bacterium]|nr:hypothetical protein [Chloroflexota bacterium]
MNLKPCPFRLVDSAGQILCDKIKTGDREVSAQICNACPVAAIDCAHLRATLDHQTRPAITVRWGNGKSEVWDNAAPTIALGRAACAAKVVPIHSPRDCVGCPLRESLTLENKSIPASTLARRAPRPAPAPAQPLVAEARSNIVAQKIIQLQDWLAKQKTLDQDQAAEPRAHTRIAHTEPPRRIKEEKRVGWTD